MRQRPPPCRHCGCAVLGPTPCCGVNAWKNVADPEEREVARLAIVGADVPAEVEDEPAIDDEPADVPAEWEE